MTTSAIELAERLLDIAENDDHARGCQGLEYSCTCGYDVRTMKTAEEAADFLESLSQPVPGAVSDAMVAAAQDAWIKTRLKSNGNHKSSMRAALEAALSARVAEASGEPGWVPVDPRALVALIRGQRQLDADGVEVGVSRQALDELIVAYSNGVSAVLASSQGDKALREALDNDPASPHVEVSK